MTNNKNKRPGAYKSCLIPYKEQIFKWWFDDKKTSREIQALLSETSNIEVHWTTIARFIKVRTQKNDPHERPSHLIQQPPKENPVEPQMQAAPSAKEKSEAEELLRHLRESTPQQLWREANQDKRKCP